MGENLEKAKVSIIIPTYNSGKTLPECFKSIHAQSCPFCEVIVVDNFSIDNTLKIAEKFGAKILQRKCNPALARNIGIAISTGKYILFIDSDQVLSTSLVEECVEICESEKAGMIRIPEVFIGKSFWGSCSAIWKNCYEKVEGSYTGSRLIIHGEPRFFVKEQVISVGMLDPSLLWGEDSDLHERLKKKGVKEVLCKSKIYHCELSSIKEIMIRNLRYGKSMPMFTQQTGKQIFSPLLKNAWLTFGKVFWNFKKSPAIIVGCAILLFLKTYSITVGLIVGFIKRFSR